MIKKYIKNIFSIHPLTVYNKRNRFIFIYHDVSKLGTPLHSEHYSTDEELFKKHLRFYLKYFEMVSLDEIISETIPANNNYASLTFDDGFFSVRETVFPLLNNVGIPFTIFVNKHSVQNNSIWFLGLLNAPDKEYLFTIYKIFKENNSNQKINFDTFSQNHFEMILENFSVPLAESILSLTPLVSKKIFMDENDINYLSSSGVAIGNHSIHHYNLFYCDDRIMQKEINGNKVYLENLTGKKINHFAIPFGKKEHYSRKVITIAQSLDSSHVYSSNPMRFSLKKNFTAIPRIGLTNQSISELIFLINRTFIYKYKL